MKFTNFLFELSSKYGSGITFFDIDETIFRTKAEISVVKDKKVVRKLTNQEFNTYKLQTGEEFDFGEFRNAKLFKETSEPIEKVVERIVKMLKTADKSSSSIVLLTARADFDDKEVFLQTFRDVGIDIDRIYIERVGNLTAKNKKPISINKKSTILKYLKTGKYRRVRLIDDDMKNIKTFLELKDELPSNIIDKVKSTYNIKGEESINPIEFYALLVLPDGKLRRIE